MKKYTIEVCEKVEMYETYTLEVPEDVDIKDVIKDIDNSNGNKAYTFRFIISEHLV